jgi:hypothetical protein
LCCFCLHITEYEQIRGGQNFLGPRGVKYLNTALVPVFVGRIMVVVIQLIPYAYYSVTGSGSEFVTNKFVLVTECAINR